MDTGTSSDGPREIGEQVRRERLRHGMTQSQLAEAAGIAPNTVIAIEKGRNHQEMTLAKVMDALGMEPAGEIAERAGWPPDVHLVVETVGLALMGMPESERAAAAARLMRALFSGD